MKNIGCRLTITISLFAIIMILFPFAGYTQQLELENISKIIVQHDFVTRNTSELALYEVTRDGNSWISKRTGYHARKFSSDLKWHTEDSVEKKFISRIDDKNIHGLINSLNHPIREFNPQAIGITATFLKTNADLLFKQQMSELNAEQSNGFKQFITDEKIKKSSFPDVLFIGMGVDVNVYFDIDIVKNDQDTIKLQASTFSDPVLPWITAKNDSLYNIDIASFCAKARGIDLFTGGKMINLENFYGDFYKWVYDEYCKEEFTAGLFEEQDIDCNSLRYYCTISDLSTDDKPDAADPVLHMSLNDTPFYKNVNFNTFWHIKDPDNLKHTFSYGQVIEKLFKHPNFLFEFISHSPTFQLTFELRNDLKDYQLAQTKYPYLKDFPENAVKEFHVQNKSDNELSTWFLLPNGQLVLNDFSGSKVLNFTAKQLGAHQHTSGDMNEVCVVFDGQGNLIQNFTNHREK
jgi:hypothetical protein